MAEPTQSIFELTLARPVVLPEGPHPMLVHLWWRSAADPGRLVQVYVDDELYDVTADAAPRQVWLVLDRTQPHRIELLAVPSNEAWTARPERLTGWQPRVGDAAHVTVLRDEALAVSTRLGVAVDGELRDEAALWPSDAHRGGFGALFGEGGFGFDAITGPGLGMGELGYGTLGADGSAWRWRRGDLEPGEHTLTLEGRDHTAQPTTQSATQSLTIDRLSEPARGLRVEPGFTLEWA